MDGLLPLELTLLVAGYVGSVAARSSARDLNTPCSGQYSPLNAGFGPPGELYNFLIEPCRPSQNILSSSACYCNLAAYNLRQAASYCNGEAPRTWKQWAATYNCSNSTSPPAQPTADFEVSLPSWATQALSDSGTFDVDKALQSASGSSKWTTVQIVVPIVVGLAVALAAVLFFLWYKRRNRNSSSRYARSSRKEAQAWQDSKLRGHRRLFGLLPDRPTVRSRSRKESNWSIDASDLSHEGIELSGPGATLHAHGASRAALESYHDRPASGHSRSESATSLLSSPSAKTNTSWISAIASFLPTTRAYQSGVKKEKDYRRVRVEHSPLPGKFDLEGEPYDPPPPAPPPPSAYSTYYNSSAAPAASTSNPQVSGPQEPPQRQSSLPSFVDIRRQSTGLDSTSRHATGGSSFATPPTTMELHRGPPRVVHGDEGDGGVSRVNSERTTAGRPPASEFSLGSSGLMTPTVTDTGSMPFVTSPRQASFASPLLPRGRQQLPFAPPQDPDQEPYNPHMLSFRNDSTDSLSYPVYPRNQPAF